MLQSKLGLVPMCKRDAMVCAGAVWHTAPVVAVVVHGSTGSGYANVVARDTRELRTSMTLRSLSSASFPAFSSLSFCFTSCLMSCSSSSSFFFWDALLLSIFSSRILGTNDSQRVLPCSAASTVADALLAPDVDAPSADRRCGLRPESLIMSTQVAGLASSPAHRVRGMHVQTTPRPHWPSSELSPVNKTV